MLASLLPITHYLYLATLNIKEPIYLKILKFDKAIEKYEQYLAIFEKVYGSDHQQVAITLGALGNAYGDSGNYQKKIELQERALAIFEKVYGADHQQVAITLNNLGNAYGDSGNYQKQIELQERALAIFEKVYGADHQEVAITLTNLGNAYGDSENYQKQIELQERALAIFEKVYGADHQQVAITLGALGNAYGDSENYQKQIELQERALAIKEKVYGADHQEVAITLTNLGNAYGDSGNYQKKIELQERALKIFLDSYENDHPHVKICCNELLKAYNAMGYNTKEQILENAPAELHEVIEMQISEQMMQRQQHVMQQLLALLQGSASSSNEGETLASGIDIRSKGENTSSDKDLDKILENRIIEEVRLDVQEEIVVLKTFSKEIKDFVEIIGKVQKTFEIDKIAKYVVIPYISRYSKEEIGHAEVLIIERDEEKKQLSIVHNDPLGKAIEEKLSEELSKGLKERGYEVNLYEMVSYEQEMKDTCVSEVVANVLGYFKGYRKKEIEELDRFKKIKEGIIEKDVEQGVSDASSDESRYIIESRTIINNGVSKEGIDEGVKPRNKLQQEGNIGLSINSNKDKSGSEEVNLMNNEVRERREDQYRYEQYQTQLREDNYFNNKADKILNKIKDIGYDGINIVEQVPIRIGRGIIDLLPEGLSTKIDSYFEANSFRRIVEITELKEIKELFKEGAVSREGNLDIKSKYGIEVDRIIELTESAVEVAKGEAISAKHCRRFKARRVVK